MIGSKSAAYEVQTVNRIAVVPAVLDAMVRTTGMRFAAVASVNDRTWTVCAVQDLMSLGLLPGDEVPLDTNAHDLHANLAKLPASLREGFASHVSVPIIRADGSCFGVLFASDARPGKTNELGTMKTLELLAQLVALNIDADANAMMRARLVETTCHVADAHETLDRELRYHA